MDFLDSKLVSWFCSERRLPVVSDSMFGRRLFESDEYLLFKVKATRSVCHEVLGFFCYSQTYCWSKRSFQERELESIFW